MITSALKHVRQNLVAFVALFVALSGTGWAAINLPAGSVGSRQLRNHSVTPVKFDRGFINGTVRAWAVVAPDGAVQAGAGQPSVFVVKVAQGSYVITWKTVRTPTFRGCFASGGLTGESGVGGSAEASVVPNPSKRNGWVDVSTYDSHGQPVPQYFYAALVC